MLSVPINLRIVFEYLQLVGVVYDGRKDDQKLVIQCDVESKWEEDPCKYKVKYYFKRS